LEDIPVIVSCTVIINNIAIKKIVKPLNIHFNEFLIVGFIARADTSLTASGYYSI
jgi:hypothetical protein